MAVVAVQMRSSTRGPIVHEMLAESPAIVNRIELTDRLTLAKRFVDQAAIDAYVTARGGTPSQWKAMTLPTGID